MLLLILNRLGTDPVRILSALTTNLTSIRRRATVGDDEQVHEFSACPRRSPSRFGNLR